MLIAGGMLAATRGTMATKYVEQVSGRIAATDTGRRIVSKMPAQVRRAFAANLVPGAAPALLNDFSKTSIPAPGATVSAGDAITYITRVKNNDSRADDAPRIIDPLPAGTTLVSFAINAQPSNAFTCDVTTNPGSLTCYTTPYASGGKLPADAPFEVQYTVRVNANANPGTLTAAGANYRSNNGGATPPGQGRAENLTSNTVSHTIVRRHDLAITKVSMPDAVAAGGLVNYMITLTNNGPSTVPALDATVTDNILSQPNITLQGAIAAPKFTGTCNGGTSFSTCKNNVAIAPGESLGISYQIKVNANFSPIPGTVTNTATVSAGAADQNATNNTATKVVTVSTALADLRIKKNALIDNFTAIAGDPNSIITYQIDYFNNGPASANNIEIRDVVPVNLNADDIFINAPNWECNNFVIIPGRPFVCKFTSNGGVLPPGQGSADLGGTLQPIYFQARVPASVAPGTIIANQAMIQSPVPDPNSANNVSLPTSTLVKTLVDLSINKVDSPDPATAGQTFSYRIIIPNNPGPSDARDVVWSDMLPPQVTFVSLAGPINSGLPGSWACTTPPAGSSGLVSCTRALLPVNSGDQEFGLTVRVKPGFAGNQIQNVAVVGSSTTDTNPGNNEDQEYTDIIRQVDLTITKATNSGTVIAGDNITYTIQAGNNGPSAALGAKVTDTLPANTTFVSASGTGVFGSGGGGCAFGAGTVTCTPADGILPAGGAETITIVAKTNPGFAGTIGPNKATVSATNPVASKMSNQVNVNAIIRSDIAIEKQDSPDAVTAGQEIFYTLKITNNGPSDAPTSSITVSDPTPANTNFVGGSLNLTNAAGFTCTTSPLSCTNSGGKLSAGQMATIVLKVAVNANAPTGFIINTATVSSPNDTNATNNSSSVQTAVGPNADLQLTKAAATAAGALQNAIVTAGGTFSGAIGSAPGAIDYTLTYKNNGPSAASNVVITDVLPGNTLFVPGSFSTTGPIAAANCQVVPGPGAGNQARCTAATLNVGDQGTISFRVRVPAEVAAGTVIRNQAIITADTPDPNTSSNTSIETQNTVRNAADLSIQKSATTTVVAGDVVTYTLTVTNNITATSGSNAKDVVVQDALPAGATFVSVASSNNDFSCTAPTVGTNGTVNCNRALMPAGASSTITIVAKVDPAQTASPLVNNASVSASTTDPTPSNNTASASTAITRQVSLAISKTGAPSPVIAGSNLTYTITAANTGLSAAIGVSVTDPIPASTSYVSASGTGLFAGSQGGGCTFASGTVTCVPANNTLPPNTSETITIVVKVAPNAPATIGPNVATITSANPNSSASSQPVNIPVIRQVDMTIAKEDSPDAVQAGQNIVYTLTVTNNGPSEAPANAVTVTDNVPANTTIVGTPDVSLAPGFTCTTGVSCKNSGAPMAPGAQAIIRFTVQVNAGYGTGAINNVATVAANDGQNNIDPNPDNNTATKTTSVGPFADLQLTKSGTPASVTAGGPAPGSGQIVYTINYRNSGPSDAAGVQITDTVSANLMAAGPISAPGLDCDGASPAPGVQFICRPVAGAFGSNAAGVLPVNASGTITYTVKVPPSVAKGTLISNTALITSVGPGSTPDSNTSNNTQTPTSTVVNTSADLKITKSDSPDPVLAGQELSYTITVSNTAGPSDAQNVVITDTLPSQTTFVSAVANDPSVSCTAPAVGSEGIVTCNMATLPFGSSVQVLLTVKVKSSVPSGASISNTATVGSQTTDPASSNNSATTSTAVQTSATLAVVKTDSPDPVVAGTNLTYTITVTNNGPSDAQAVTLNDPLPAGTSFVSLSGNGIFQPAGACSHNGGAPGTVNCGGGLVLPAGTTATLNVIVKVASSAQIAPPAQPINNTVSVSSPTDAGGPRTAQSSTNVRREADLELTKTAPAQGIAGQNIDYTLKLRNIGPSNVDGGGAPGTIVITDSLPAGVVPLSPLSSPNLTVSGPGGFTCSYDSPAGTVICKNAAGDPGDFPAGSIATIIFKARLASNLGANTNINNCATATLTGPEVDPIEGNNSSCASTVVQTSADLGAGKTAPQQGVAGQNITFNLTFGNAGPSDAINVRITDNIPANTTYVTPVSPFTILAVGGVYTGSNSVKLECTVTGGNTLTCTPKGNTGLTPSLADGVLPAGVTGAFSYDVKINASVTGGTILANGVNITSAPSGSTPGTPDPNAANNTSLSTSTVVIAQSQLVVTKAVQSAIFAQSPPAAPNAVVPGTNLTYRISVTNNGPSDVTNVQVADTLPTNVTYQSAVPAIGSGFTCLPVNGGVVTCNAPLLPAGVTRTIDITVFIDPATKADLVNKADATGISNGFNQVLNAPTFTLTTPVGPTSDLVLTKTHTPEPVIAGANVVYTLTLKNNGPSTAAMVNMVDTLPAFQSLAGPADVSGAPGFTCAPNTPGSTGNISCTAPSLAPNAQVVIRLTARIDPSAPAAVYSNLATASSMSYDPTPASASDPVTVITRADLSVSKSAPATVVAGTQITYTITATNNGPSSASNMSVSDVLPTGVVFVSANAPESSTTTTPAVNANGTVKATWAGLTLPGVTRQLTIVVRVCSEVACDTSLNNTATTASETTDPVTSNNSSTAMTKVEARWDLSITATGPATAAPNTTITYNLTVANAGPSVATKAIVTNVLPVGATVVGTPASTLAGTIVNVTTSPTTGQQTITFNLGSVGADNQCGASLPKTATMTIVAKLAVTIPFHQIVDRASVASTANCATGSQGDQNAENNSASITTRIINIGPELGMAYEAAGEVSDQKAGSVLIYPIYTSDAANPNRENTRISITNAHPTERACIHLFGVDGASCGTADAFVCLTPNQTTSFLASDLDPGNRGYFVAVAVDCETGLPRAHNYLIGDSYVKFSSGHQANLGAEAISAIHWAPAGTSTTARTVNLEFDGIHYNRLPTMLSMDTVLSPADGNATMLIVDRIGGDLTNTAATVGPLFGLLFNDQEVGFSFTTQVGACQFRQTLSNSFPRTLTPFSNVIPAGRTGWIKFWSNNEYGIFGASINFNANSAANSGAFNQGHNLHKLTLAPSATLTIPVVIPFC
jgi:uncharacterized repeat protein (TIGR01451 family)